MISKNLLAKILLVMVVGSMLALPVIGRAAEDQSGANVPYSAPSFWPTGYWGPLVWCTGDYLPAAQANLLKNANGTTPPSCTNLCDLIGTFINIIYFIMSIALFIITPIMFLVGSIMVMISGANPEMLGRGKKVLYSLVIGIAIVLGAYLIVNTVITVFHITGIGGFWAVIQC